MRKSKAETAKTRERILEAARAQFLSHGITEAGLARLMRAAGLTHGSRSPPGSNPKSRGSLPIKRCRCSSANTYPAVTGTSRRPVVSLPHSVVNWRVRMARHGRPPRKVS
jgi:hypothetical protein